MKRFAVFCLFVLCAGVLGADAEVVGLPAAAPAAKALTWLDILGNPGVVTLLATLAVGILKYLHDKKNLDEDRWIGLVYSLYNAAEKAGVMQKWSGAAKLEHAMELFAEQYKRTFGHYPAENEKQDMANDLARLARSDKPAFTATVTGGNTPPEL